MEKQIAPGYKQTRIGIIPEDWEVKRLGTLSSHFKSGKGITSKNIEEKGKYPVYGGNGLRGFTDNFTHNGSYLLIGRQGALCGNIQKIKGKSYISEHAVAVQTNDENDLEFLASKLEYFNLNRLSESSAQPGLAVNKLVRLRLPIPPLPEQKAIADCLTTWDKGIEKLTALIQAKKQQKKGLMQGLFNGQLRVDNGQLVQAKEREGFTEDWEEVMLKDISKVTKGKQLNRNELTDTGEFPSYSGGITPSGFTDEFNCKADTIIISEGGNSCGFVNFIDVDFWLGGHCYSINEKKRNTNKIFLYNLLKFNQLKIMTLRVGSGLPNVQKGALEKFKLIIPPSLKEQSAIAEVLSTADKEIDLLQYKMEKMQLQKKGLMQVLLTGKKRLIENQ